MPWADLPAWTAAIPFIRTMSPIADYHRRDANLCGRYSGTSQASNLMTWLVIGSCRDQAPLRPPGAADILGGDYGRVADGLAGEAASDAP
jgi:hypothetical protein